MSLVVVVAEVTAAQLSVLVVLAVVVLVGYLVKVVFQTTYQAAEMLLLTQALAVVEQVVPLVFKEHAWAAQAVQV